MQQPLTIDFSHLRVLRELSERGTVTAAAAELHLSPSAVSQQLRALSQSLGAPLTERVGRKLRLTPQALLVLKHADEISTQVEQVRADLAAFQEGHIGRVSIASFASAVQPLVVPALRRLAHERPQLELIIIEAEAPDAFKSLDDAEIDVLVTIDYVTGPPTHAAGRYCRIELLRDPLVAIVPANHSLASRPSIEIGELAQDRWVMGTVGHPCVDATIAAQTAAGFTANVAHRANDWAAAAALVASGQGVALVPELAMTSIVANGISVSAVSPPIARSIYAAVRNGSETAPHITAALNALRQTAEDITSPPRQVSTRNT